MRRGNINAIFVLIHSKPTKKNSTHRCRHLRLARRADSVEDKDVTVRLADKKRDIPLLISYAVGCMWAVLALYKGCLCRRTLGFTGSKVDLLSDYAKASGVHPWNPSALYLPDRDNVITSAATNTLTTISSPVCTLHRGGLRQGNAGREPHFIADALGSGGAQPKRTSFAITS